MLAQSRSWLPDPIGGLYWFTPDDAFTSCFAPFYCGMESLPKPYEQGELNRFSPDSAWWVFNLVSNLTYDRYSRILPDVQAAQKEWEKNFLEWVSMEDEMAGRLYAVSREQARRHLTRFSISAGNDLVARWKELAAMVLTRHNDGYLNDLTGEPKGIGYSQEWLRRVAAEKGAQLRYE